MESIYEQMGGTYHAEGDYLLPDLEISVSDHDIGLYGRRHKRYLDENHPGLYARLLLSGRLWELPAETDKTCSERMARLVPAMAEREGVTEALKASDQFAWVGRMNSIRDRAEEIVLRELVYSL